MFQLENDPHGNLAFVKAMAGERAVFDPRPVSSVVDILGGFFQSRILVDSKFTGDLQSVSANGSFSVTIGRGDQSAGYVFPLENGHGLCADIFGDGKIVVTLLSQENQIVRTDFDGLIRQLNHMSQLEKGPFARPLSAQPGV